MNYKILVFLLFFGCGTSHKNINLPENQGGGFLIRCKKSSPLKCKMRAKELCPPEGLYTVIKKLKLVRTPIPEYKRKDLYTESYEMLVKCSRASTVSMKNGDVLKGVILEEKEGEYIQFQFKDESQKRIKMSEIDEISRGN